MGFRCPYCHRDFDKDIEKWIEHCKREHAGVVIKILNLINDVKKDEKKGES